MQVFGTILAELPELPNRVKFYWTKNGMLHEITESTHVEFSFSFRMLCYVTQYTNKYQNSICYSDTNNIKNCG